jgi:hypothetical protein
MSRDEAAAMADRVVHFEVTGPDGEALKRF